MTTATSPSLISMPEIAELAGVRRPVVTTWRRRHADFPAPVGGDRGRPLFDALGVVDWLVGTGRAERTRIEPDLRLYQLSALATGTRRLPPRELVAALTALICLRYLDDEPLSGAGDQSWQVAAGLRDRAARVDADDALLRNEIELLPGGAGWLAAATDDLIEAAWGCQQAYERVLAARTRLDAADLYVDAVDEAAARLLAGLSGAREHADEWGSVRLAAPRAGAGDLLVAVLDTVGEGVPATVAATDPDPLLARLLRRRLVVRGVPEHHPGEAPDVTVTGLPYQPMEERGDADPLAETLHLADQLAPGATAVVLGPADLLAGAVPPSRVAARTRNTLLASGMVEAVVRLPGGLVPFRPAYQTAVWVLRREEDPSPWRGRVLLADVSDRRLTSEVADALVWDVATWRRSGHRPDQHLRAYATEVTVSDLIAPERPLTTRQPVRLRDLAEPERAVARAVELDAALGPGTHSGLAVRAERAIVRREAVGTLVRNGWLVMRQGNRIAPGDVGGGGGHYRVVGAPELTGGRAVGSRTVDRAVLADRYQRARLTEPDDVVVTLTPRLGAYRDSDGFAVVEFPARVLRIPAGARHRLTPRVLAALLAALPETGHPTARALGAVRPPARLADLHLPVLEPGEVARLDELLAAAEARRRELDQVVELCRIATSGLVHGTLTMAGATDARGNR